MARIRTLKPEIWEDEALGGCSLEARLLYVGLITQADDAGRFRARGALLRARVFPYDDGESGRPRISGQTVSLWLNELAVAHLVALYEIEGEVYGCFDGDSWQRHQKIDRPSPSKIPAPRESQSALFPVTPGALGEASSSPRRVFVEPSTTDQEGIRKGSGRDLDQKERECAREAAPTVADYFAVLVELYPRQPIEGELAVQRELFSAEKLLPPLEVFRANLIAWRSSERWLEKGGWYVPKPAKWVRDGDYLNPPPDGLQRFSRPALAVDPATAGILSPRWQAILKRLFAEGVDLFDLEVGELFWDLRVVRDEPELIELVAPRSGVGEEIEKSWRLQLFRAAEFVSPGLSIAITGPVGISAERRTA